MSLRHDERQSCIICFLLPFFLFKNYSFTCNEILFLLGNNEKLEEIESLIDQAVKTFASLTLKGAFWGVPLTLELFCFVLQI